jgi:hypothetical protein
MVGAGHRRSGKDMTWKGRCSMTLVWSLTEPESGVYLYWR